MDAQKLETILKALAQGQMSPDEAFDQLKGMTFDDIGFAKIDQYREARQGIPEVIYCPGKTASQIVAIVHAMKVRHYVVLASRADRALAEKIHAMIPDGYYDELSRTLIFCRGGESGFNEIGLKSAARPKVAVVTAGTADLAVAEEAAIYLKASGIGVERISDVGVAGIHRLFPYIDTLNNSLVVIVVAGMDGALPSVIGGLVRPPVICVPTSTGYGASFQGLSALLTMLNSCAAGLTVVNIDNGFGAAMAAVRIAGVCNLTNVLEEPGV
jgi:NCAIR mutase (PurE)-related protein